jgi:serine phosphatase RsbU (regulator of sigma subunit)
VGKFAFLLLLAPVAGFAQPFVTISPENCVWHAGDDAAGALHWAAPDFDDSGWKPYALWKLNPDEPRIWIRCHVDLSTLRATAQPAVQLNLEEAYELFFEGKQSGTFGNMETGNFTADVVRTFPLAAPIPVKGESTIALRIQFRGNPGSQFGLTRETNEANWVAGDRQQLEDRRNSLAFVHGSRTLPTTIAFFIVGIAGVMMLGLYLSDRSRPAFLFFALVCWALAIRRITEQLVSSLYPVPLIEDRVLDGFLVAALTCYVFMVYALVRKPVPWFYRCVIGLSMILPMTEVTVAILPAALSLRMVPLLGWNIAFANVLFGVSFFSPFVAFRPWRHIAGSMRYVAAVLMVWAVSNEVYIAFLLSRNFSVRSVAPFVNTWWPVVQQARATLMIAAIVVLLVLLFRDQRKTAEERALLAGEMDAAREVQRRLVPSVLPEIAGCLLEAVYLPANEVGGDFYQVLEQADRATLVIVGDVSGKGLKAAMTGALAIGAIRTLAAEGLGPAELLRRLNVQIVEAGNEGFITCICARLENDKLAIANAGHLSPYRNGEEVVVDSGFPLGIVAGAEYGESVMTLVMGDRITLLSDGVLEARGASGELLGFTRMAELTRRSAAEIADAAQSFGQDDDITVLTLKFEGLEGKRG